MAEASSDDALSPPDASEPVEREPKLDLVLDYLAFAARSHPLGMLLDEAPRRMAAAIDADVASVYLLEGDGDTLVLRGTVGQPKKARGKVRLAVGEGITGTAVAHQYPIATAHVGDHRHNRPFPELDEERFPALLAVPIVGTTGPLGAIVLQRTAGRAFSPAEIRSPHRSPPGSGWRGCSTICAARLEAPAAAPAGSHFRRCRWCPAKRSGASPPCVGLPAARKPRSKRAMPRASWRPSTRHDGPSTIWSSAPTSWASVLTSWPAPG
jgi:hypothetical protein